MQIIDVTDWEKSEYPIGTRKKYVYVHPRTRQKAFFKYPMDFDKPEISALGEVWSEKIAADIGKLIGIPTANVAIAKNKESYGSLSYSFLQNNEELIHGAELLSSIAGESEFNPKNFGHHKLEHILLYFFYYHEYDIELVYSFIDVILFDAFIGNTDRHSENWGIVKGEEKGDKKYSYKLAPAFDNSSSLGREFASDKKRSMYINDDNLFRKYICKNCNACLSLGFDSGRINHFMLVKSLLSDELAIKKRVGDYLLGNKTNPDQVNSYLYDQLRIRKRVRETLNRLDSVTEQSVDAILSNIPCTIMSDISKTLTKKILINRKNILLKIRG